MNLREPEDEELVNGYHTWDDIFANYIFESLVQEMENSTLDVAFPAEFREEEREFNPLDQPDDELDEEVSE